MRNSLAGDPSISSPVLLGKSNGLLV